MNHFIDRLKALAVVLYLFAGNTCIAATDEIQIVAFGASFTYGQGVGGHYNAFPAKLESLLKAEGENVTIKNRGVSGDTSVDLKIKLDRAVPDGVKIVIFEYAFGNDRKAMIPIETTVQNVEECVSRLKARDIQALLIVRGPHAKGLMKRTGLFMPIIQKYDILHIAIEQTQDSLANDREHPSVASHAEYAARMVPLVKTLIERIKNQNKPS